MSDNPTPAPAPEAQPAALPDLGPGITVLSMDAGPAAIHDTIAGALGEVPPAPAVPVVHDLGTLGDDLIRPARVVLDAGMDGLLGRMVAHAEAWAQEAERLAQAAPATLADIQAHVGNLAAHMGDLAGLLDKVVTFAHGLAHHLDKRGAE